MGEEKYEAHAYIKIKGEEKDPAEKKSRKKLMALLGEVLFRKALTELYNDGMTFGLTDAEFMVKVTDFFINTTASYYISDKKPEQQTIKEISDFLDAVKQDTIETIKHTFLMREDFQF